MSQIRGIKFFGAVLAFASTLSSVPSCDRRGTIIDIDGRKPEKLDGTIHVSWQMARYPTFESLSCAVARAQFVLMRVEAADQSSPPRTYRMRCDLPVPEAWLPITTGSWNVRGEAVDAAGQQISVTPEQTITARTTTDHLTTPLLLQVK